MMVFSAYDNELCSDLSTLSKYISSFMSERKIVEYQISEETEANIDIPYGSPNPGDPGLADNSMLSLRIKMTFITHRLHTL